MSGVTEVKQGLRKTDFPICARDALARIEQLLSSKTPSIKNMDLAIDLMAEFVFCEVDRRGTKRLPLTALQQLQLLEVLSDFFSSSSGEAIKNTVFLSLFSATSAVQRASILCKLVSIAVSIPFAPLLTSAGTWMQQLGNTSGHSHKLARALLTDYFVLVPNAIAQLQVLPHIAPQFTANFLTAVADIYFVETKNSVVEFPSNSLLEIVTCWLSDNSKLCIAAQQTQSCLPTGAIAMEAVTPLAGLLRWTVLAPIYDQDNELYAKLHLALLHSLLDAYTGTGPPKAVSASHLSAPIPLLLKFGSKNSQSEQFQKSLDRYAQAVQVAISSSCVYGNIADLFAQLQQLPISKLLSIVINMHRQNI